ncbi:hypothetical protein NDU88_002426 [Pleurodeles waltl]|uniref:Uncharacterized protein n=1 Tax=Pleurodeles waltl TaxID=8319 RepID=A0AAV7P882_PLEWA|nr:hypothetical protein NDU88_002426 [Pleurodeles waltl]
MCMQPQPRHGPRLNGAGNPASGTPPGRLSSPAGAASVSESSRSRGVNTALPAPVSTSSSRRPGRPTGSRGMRPEPCHGRSGGGKSCGPAVRAAGRTLPCRARSSSASQLLRERRPQIRCVQYMCPVQSVRLPAPGVVWAPRGG